MTKIELNTYAPEFTASDFNGKRIALSSFINRRKVYLVFNRGFS